MPIKKELDELDSGKRKREKERAELIEVKVQEAKIYLEEVEEKVVLALIVPIFKEFIELINDPEAIIKINKDDPYVKDESIIPGIVRIQIFWNVLVRWEYTEMHHDIETSSQTDSKSFLENLVQYKTFAVIIDSLGRVALIDHRKNIGGWYRTVQLSDNPFEPGWTANLEKLIAISLHNDDFRPFEASDMRYQEKGEQLDLPDKDSVIEKFLNGGMRRGDGQLVHFFIHIGIRWLDLMN